MVWGHCFVVTLLYLTQGIAQGVSGSAATYFLTHFPNDVSNATVATLGLPVYAFSFKFLWSPVIDGIFIGVKAKYRRLYWILPMQLLMTVIFCLFALELGKLGGEGRATTLGSSLDSQFQDKFSALTAAEKDTFFWMLTIAFSMLAAAAAVQDVAVDGWAIEGLPSHQASLASTTQTVGLILGSTSTVIFLLIAPKYPEVVTLERFMWSAALTSMGAIPICLTYVWFAGVPALPTEEEESLNKASLWSHYKTLWRMVTQSKPFMRMILITQTMNIAGATVSIMNTNLTRLGYFTTDQLVLLDLIHRALQIFMAASVNAVIGRRGCDLVVARALKVDPWLILLALGGYLLTPLVMSSSSTAGTPPPPAEGQGVAQWVLSTLTLDTWPFGWFALIWLSQSLVIMISDSFSFTAACTLKVTIAAQHKGLSASAITVLNACANFGRKWPMTLALYVHGPLQAMLTNAASTTPTADAVSPTTEAAAVAGSLPAAPAYTSGWQWSAPVVSTCHSFIEAAVVAMVDFLHRVFIGRQSLLSSWKSTTIGSSSSSGVDKVAEFIELLATQFSQDSVYLLTLVFFLVGMALMWMVVFPTLKTYRSLVVQSMKRAKMD